VEGACSVKRIGASAMESCRKKSTPSKKKKWGSTEENGPPDARKHLADVKGGPGGTTYAAGVLPAKDRIHPGIVDDTSKQNLGVRYGVGVRHKGRCRPGTGIS